MILIFRSNVTNAVYSWNGKQTVTIVGATNRPVGKIMQGFDNKYLKAIFEKNYAAKHSYNYFQVGEADYQILQRIYT